MANLNKRSLIFNVASLEKFGEENIKILELDERERIGIISVQKPRIFYLFYPYFELPYTFRVVIYNFAKKEIEYIETFTEPEFWIIYYENFVSEECDFCMRNKIFKYDTKNKTYDIIDIGEYYASFIHWTKKPIKCIILSEWPNNALIIYDKNTNNLTYFYNVVPSGMNVILTYEEINKIYVLYNFKYVREINLTNGEYIDIELPEYVDNFFILHNPLRIYYVDIDGKIKMYDVNREELITLRDLKEEFNPNTDNVIVSPDKIHKRLFISARARPYIFARVLFVYDIEKNELKRIGIFEQELVKVYPTKYKDKIIVNDIGYRLFNYKIVDLNKLKVIGYMSADEWFYIFGDFVDII